MGPFGNPQPSSGSAGGLPPRVASLANRIARLSELQVAEIERVVARCESQAHSSLSPGPSLKMEWPHAPLHRLVGNGTYIVTAGTLNKEHHFQHAEELELLQGELLAKAKAYGWQLEAWACFSNHYHFVGHALRDARSLKPFLTHLHADTARQINTRQDQPNRQVWFNYWETELTFQTSYLARLSYVHQNPVHHGLVAVPNQYRWCSAAWFERTATPAQVKTIYGMKIDRVNVIDDFDTMVVDLW